MLVKQLGILPKEISSCSLEVPMLLISRHIHMNSALFQGRITSAYMIPMETEFAALREMETTL